MIYFCADDYGLCNSASQRIQRCIEHGALNKVSVFPNLDKIELQPLLNKKDIRLSLHLNLVEGKCMANPDEITLLADKKGNLKHAFGGLLKLNLFRKTELASQVYKELKAQILFWKSILPPGMEFCIDSHQHTHIIPTIFKTLLQVLKDEEIPISYLRIPVEPALPYLKTPSLYLTYNPINIIKQWLLRLLWLFNKKYVKESPLPTSHFIGVLLSGKMDEKRVSKILPKVKNLAEKDNRDIEVLFHPGFLEECEFDFQNKNILFKKFYFSKNRKMEYDSVMNLSERSGLE